MLRNRHGLTVGDTPRGSCQFRILHFVPVPSPQAFLCHPRQRQSRQGSRHLHFLPSGRKHAPLAPFRIVTSSRPLSPCLRPESGSASLSMDLGAVTVAVGASPKLSMNIVAASRWSPPMLKLYLHHRPRREGTPQPLRWATILAR